MTLTKIRQFIKSVHFRLSDLFFFVGFISLAVFLIFGQLYMQFPDPNDLALKTWAFIPLFIILVVSWGTYVYLEYKIGNKTPRCVNIVFIILAILAIISIVIQPHDFSIDFISSEGNRLHAEVEISRIHSLFFIFELLSILSLIYIGLFIFPKRFKSVKFLLFIGYSLFVLCLVLCVYSYIVEKDNYIPFITYLLNAENSGAIKHYAMQSFIINPNAYGMTLMMGVMFCYIHHAINHKWWNFLIALFFYINMIFSFCRTCLILSLIISIIYIYQYLLSTKKEKPLIKKIVLISLTSVIGLLILLVGISYITKGEFIKPLYSLISTSFSISSTIGSREVIWSNTYQLISQNAFLYFLFGRGFGVLNEMLLQMNNQVGLEGLFPTHNGYLTLFAEGGIFYLLAYLVLLFYVIYIFIKCYKKQASLSTALFFGTLVFSFYSLFETIHYLVYPFMFLILVQYNVLYSKEEL